jgi:hypothetical protein
MLKRPDRLQMTDDAGWFLLPRIQGRTVENLGRVQPPRNVEYEIELPLCNWLVVIYDRILWIMAPAGSTKSAETPQRLVRRAMTSVHL